MASRARLPDGRALPKSCVSLVVALAYRQRFVKAGVVFIGNFALGGLAGVSARTVTDDKYLLEAAHLVYLANTGADGKVPGGKTRDEHGQVVAAATGYQLHPDLHQVPRQESAAPEPPAHRRRGLEVLRRAQATVGGSGP